jgi:hypothetical protein
MKKLSLILFFIVGFLYAQDCNIPGHFQFQVDNYYRGCYDAIHHGPHKICYILTKEMVQEDSSPKRVSFTTNRDGGLLKAILEFNGYKMPTTNDYTNSGYERGHMVPAEDFDHSQDAYSSTFFIGNIWPQDEDCNNPGSWYVLERYVRSLALQYGKVEICIEVTEFSDNYIGREDRKICVPLFFKKIIKYNNITEIYNIPNKSGTTRTILEIKNLLLEE